MKDDEGDAPVAWTAQSVPTDLLTLISDAAGKAHKPGGAVAQNLADVLNAYDRWRAQGGARKDEE